MVLARRMRDEFELPMPILVDSMADESRRLFSDLPSPAFILDKEGVIQAKFPWADARAIDEAVSQIVATGRYQPSDSATSAQGRRKAQ